jgi:uncharacterized repeat protein (TIGR01451 family)
MEGQVTVSSPPAKPRPAPSNNARTTAVAPIMLGSASNAYGSSSPMANCVHANDSTNTIVFVHRNNTNIWGGVNSSMRYDASTDGGATFGNDVGLLNPSNPNSRWPQVAGYDPFGNTNPANGKVIFMSDFLNGGTVWSGFVSGVSDIVISPPVNTTDAVYGTTQYSPLGGLSEGMHGEYWQARLGYSGTSYTDSLKIYKGIYNPGTQSLSWTFHTGKVLPWSRTFSGNAYCLSPTVAFSPDGSIGWIATLGDLVAGPDSVLAPVLLKSTDGGTTWGNPIELDLNAFPWVYDSLRALWLDSTNAPASNGKAMTGFHYDLTVDANGNPHMFFVIGSAGTSTMPEPQYYIWPGLEKYAVDLTSYNQGASFDLRLVAPILTFRGYLGSPSSITQDNYPQISRTQDGQYIFYSWVDTDTAQYTGNMSGIGFGESDNIAPNLWIAGHRIVDGYSSCIKAVTALDLVWEGKALNPQLAPEVLRSGTGSGAVYQLPIVMSSLDNNDPNQTTSYHYFGNDAILLEGDLAYPPGSGVSWTGCTLNSAISANIQGKLYLDLNNNATFDGGDMSMPNRVVATTPITYADYTNANGDFDITCAAPNTYGLATYVFNPSIWVPSVPASPYSLTVNAPGVVLTGNDLGFRALSSMEDLRIHMVADPFKPGFSSQVVIYVANVGTVASGGTLTFHFDSLTTYTGATPTPGTINLPAYELGWTLPSIPIFGYQTYVIDLFTPANVALGNLVDCDASAVTIGTDANPGDNTSAFTSIVVGAFDPNDKHTFPGGEGPTHRVDPGQRLAYRIRFQNTGTASAVNVVVRDTLDSDLAINSFQMLAASHNYTLNIERGNELVWTFNNINLPDSNSNEPGSHGYIDFAIDPKPNLPLGTIAENSASIYFDFNAPIITNTTWVTFDVGTSGIGGGLAAPQVRVYPHPAQESTHIERLRHDGSPWTFELLDLQGRILRTEKNISTASFLLQRNGLRPGVYLYKVHAQGLPLGAGKLVFE